VCNNYYFSTTTIVARTRLNVRYTYGTLPVLLCVLAVTYRRQIDVGKKPLNWVRMCVDSNCVHCNYVNERRYKLFIFNDNQFRGLSGGISVLTWVWRVAYWALESPAESQQIPERGVRYKYDTVSSRFKAVPSRTSRGYVEISSTGWRPNSSTYWDLVIPLSVFLFLHARFSPRNVPKNSGV